VHWETIAKKITSLDNGKFQDRTKASTKRASTISNKQPAVSIAKRVKQEPELKDSVLQPHISDLTNDPNDNPDEREMEDTVVCRVHGPNPAHKNCGRYAINSTEMNGLQCQGKMRSCVVATC